MIRIINRNRLAFIIFSTIDLISIDTGNVAGSIIFVAVMYIGLILGFKINSSDIVSSMDLPLKN